jgi:phosphatidylglycerophosphatase A
MERFQLWVAEGFGSGRLRPGPGTWGSLVGVLWTLLLLGTRNPWIYGLGILLSLPVAVSLASTAERLLGQHDPGRVVIDEIVAMPIAFGGYAIHWVNGTGQLPGWSDLPLFWPFLVAAFVLFRVFDISKPWPIRRLQSWPGGLGVVADDVAAALVTAGLLWMSPTLMFWWRMIRG